MGFRNPIAGGNTGELIRDSFRSSNYEPGVSGWNLERTGNVEFSGGQFRGAVLIGSTLTSDNYVPGVSGWTIDKAGLAEFQDIILRGRGQLTSPGYDEAAGVGWVIGEDGEAVFIGGLSVSHDGLTIGPGNLGARTVSANDSLRYRGTELSTLIARRADGIIAKTYKNTDSLHAVNGITEVSELEFTAQIGKTYGIHTSSLRVGSVAGSSLPFVRLVHTIDGTKPTTASPLLTIDNGSPVPAGSTILQRTYQASTVRKVRMWLCVSVGSGEAWLRGSDDYPIEVYVTDLADSVSDTGIDFGTGTTAVVAAPKVEYEDTAYCTWSKTFDSNNTARTDTASVYQGQSPYSVSRGNQRSLAGFDSATIRGWLSGAELLSCELTFYADHWHAFGGGVAIVGTHDYTAAPSTWADSRVAQNRLRVVSDTRDDLITVSVPLSIATGIQTGAWHGISFGPAPDTTSQYYGYMHGSGEKYEPRLSFKWRK